MLKIRTTADSVVQTVDLQLFVGTDKGRLVMFNLSLLDEGHCTYHLVVVLSRRYIVLAESTTTQT